MDAPIAEGTELIRIAVRIDAGAASRRAPGSRWSGASSATARRSPVVRASPRPGGSTRSASTCKTAGFPLVGDKMYGPDPGYFDRFSKHCLEPEAWARLRLPRHALHAARLASPTGDGRRAGLRVAAAAGFVRFPSRGTGVG